MRAGPGAAGFAPAVTNAAVGGMHMVRIGMDHCGASRNRMLAVIRGDGSAEARLDVERHVGSCTSCARDMDSIRGAWLALGEAADVVPPPALRDAVLSRIASAREAEAKGRAQWTWVLKTLLPGLGAAVASLFLAVPDPDCRTPLAIACCGAVWVALYGTAFAVFIASRRRSAGRVVAARGLAAATGGLLIARACPMESGGLAGVLFPSGALAVTSVVGAFAVGFLLVAVAVSAAIILVPPRRSGTRTALSTAAVSLGLLAPALYLGSSALALSALVALLAGAAAGALAPSLLDAALRGRTAEAT